MSSAGTVNGRGFVISYSVQSNPSNYNNAYGGFTVTIDTIVANQSAGNNGSGSTKSDSHKFFTSKIGLEFTTSTNGSYVGTGSGNMKYILGS